MSLELLKRRFWPGRKVSRDSLAVEPRALMAPHRIVFEGYPVQIGLGPRKLWLFPEVAASANPDTPIGDWLLVDPDRYFTEIAGFARISPGETLLVGRGDKNLNMIFGFEKNVAKRHLHLSNDGGEILLKPLETETETYVSRAADRAALDDLRLERLNNLRFVREIFGGPIELLAPETAMAAAQDFLDLLRGDPYRPVARNGLPGALVDLPDELTPIVVGDLHAQVDNLLTILCAGRLLEELCGGSAALVLLGDLVHREEDGKLEEMDSSLLMLDLVFKLKLRFPNNVFCLRGNHESLEDTVSKAGVPQGQILRHHAKKLRGKAYVKILAECFDHLPYVLRSTDFIACHAGPTRKRVSRDDLINIHERPKLARELIWTRLRLPNRPAGYTKGDVKSFRASLEVAKHTPLIVSHSPLSRNATYWTHVNDIKNHHIVFSAIPGKVAVMFRAGHEMIPLEYPVEPLRESIGALTQTS